MAVDDFLFSNVYDAKGQIVNVAKGIEEGCGTDAPGSFIVWLYKKVRVYAMRMPGQRYDIGTLESYEQIKSVYNGINYNTIGWFLKTKTEKATDVWYFLYYSSVVLFMKIYK